MDRRIALDYHNSLLRESDVNLLSDRQWLNDSLLAFWFEYLEHEVFHGAKDKVAFITPDVTQFLKLCGDNDAGLILEPWSLGTREAVFFALNDNETAQAGGCHWSLLFFDRTAGFFKHYDSVGSSNREIAVVMARKLWPYLEVSTVARCIEQPCPQQTNCYDCGMYVICVVEELAHATLDWRTLSLDEHVTAKAVAKKREEIRHLIRTLAQKSQDKLPT